MIDLERRKKLALHLRQLSTGQISNDDFEERIMDDVTYGWLPEQYYRSKESKCDDKIIRPILEFSWCLYNDTYNHKLKGKHELTEGQIKDIARLILFLHSDQEYDWNYVDMTNPIIRFSFNDLLKSIITFGQYYRNIKMSREQQFELMKKEGDFEYWPFKTKADYERQLKNQPFLVEK
ncbi:hypothetical protein [Winogradskyella sp. MH6]|uniref:hypothetical protein n=1 Tax=Winogradskyella sp. MH6 TaxID=2929510 RepID=UPI001FB50709|nr:hypothetical protein [Winogradskyella sp. MH6]